jgi:hypothetical protein
VLSPLLLTPQQVTPARAGAGEAIVATVSRALLPSGHRDSCRLLMLIVMLMLLMLVAGRVSVVNCRDRTP